MVEWMRYIGAWSQRNQQRGFQQIRQKSEEQAKAHRRIFWRVEIFMWLILNVLFRILFVGICG
jgi:hypothetical protein